MKKTGFLSPNVCSNLCDTVPGLREVKEPQRVEKEHVQFELGQKLWKRESKYDAKGFNSCTCVNGLGLFAVHAVWDKNAHKLRTDPLVYREECGIP